MVKKRICGLDFLRGIAILLVIGRHLEPCPASTSQILFLVSRFLERIGWIGVDIFFVLSGFLVSGLIFRELLQNGTVDFKRFLIRRWFRIYPPFAVFIIISALVGCGTSAVTPVRIVAELAFFQNYASGLWGHTWSLAVEEHFYLLLPAILWVSTKGNLKRTPFPIVPWVFGFSAIFCLGFRIWTSVETPFSFRSAVFPTHLRIDSLFLGVFIAWLFYFREEVFLKIQMRKFPLVIIAVVTLSLSFLKLEENLFVRTFGFAAISIGAACLLILLLELRFSRSNPLRLVEMLGVHSYSVYLWHLAGKAWFFPEGFAESSWFLYVVSYLSCTLFLGIGFSKLLEIPVLRFRDYFFPHPQKATSAV